MRGFTPTHTERRMHFYARRAWALALAALVASALVLLGGLLSSAWGQRRASSWVYIARNAEVSAYYDPARVRRPSEGVRRVWVKLVFRRKQASGTAYSLSLYEYDCADERERLVSSTDYRRDGSPVGGDDVGSAWTPSIPGSLGEVILDTVCRGPES